MAFKSDKQRKAVMSKINLNNDFYDKEKKDMLDAYHSVIKSGKDFDVDKWKIDRENKRKKFNSNTNSELGNWKQVSKNVWELPNDRGTIILSKTSDKGGSLGKGVYDYQGRFSKGDYIAEIYGKLASDFQRVVYPTENKAITDLKRYMRHTK